MPADTTNTRDSICFNPDAFVADHPACMRERASKAVRLLSAATAGSGLSDRQIARAIWNARDTDMASRIRAQRWNGGPLGRSTALNADDLGQVVWEIRNGRIAAAS